MMPTATTTLEREQLMIGEAQRTTKAQPQEQQPHEQEHKFAIVDRDTDFDWDKAHLQLWNTFTHYAIHGDALQPNRLRAYEFTKFAHDCGVLSDCALSKKSGSSAADDGCSNGSKRRAHPLRVADINVLITAELSKQAKGHSGPQGSRRLSFPSFLNVVLKLSLRLFPQAQSPEIALRWFVETRLWRAHRREPVSVVSVLAESQVRNLLARFGPALRPIFEFYASAAERAACDDEVESKARGSGTGGRGQRAAFSTLSWGHANRMKEELSYQAFLELAKDFGLGASAFLSMQSLGDAFLASIDYHAYHDKVPKMLFDEFIECLLRCALIIGRAAHDGATSADKLKHLLLIMWKAMTKRNQVVTAVEYHFTRTTYAADLIAGVMIFNNRFTELWAADGHRDYLLPLPEPPTDAFDLVQQLRTASAASKNH